MPIVVEVSSIGHQNIRACPPTVNANDGHASITFRLLLVVLRVKRPSRPASCSSDVRDSLENQPLARR